MKYIKLFENFKSTLLSKTLGYIDNDSKQLFKKELFAILEKIDFPESEINDNYFNYLSINKAVQLNKNGLIKFLFNSDGEYINAFVYNDSLDIDFIPDIDKYNIGEETYINNLQDGDLITMRLLDRKLTACKVKIKDGEIHILQDDYMDNVNLNYRILIDSGMLGYYNLTKNFENITEINKIHLKEKYVIRYNNRIIPHATGILNTDESIDDNDLKKADFAITFDLNELKKSNYTKKTSIQNTKEKPYVEKTPNDNKLKYFKQMSIKASNAMFDYSYLNYLLSKILKGKYSLFFILSHNTTVTVLLDFFKKEYNEKEKEIYKERLEDAVYSRLIDMEKTDIDYKLRKINEFIIDDKEPRVKEILDELMVISKLIDDWIKNIDIQSTEDVKEIHDKINYIKNLFSDDILSTTSYLLFNNKIYYIYEDILDLKDFLNLKGTIKIKNEIIKILES